MIFIPGQRWISEAELQLGLGTVLKVDQRMVSIVFLASGETRNYARETAPLIRLQFKSGDTVESHEGWHLLINRVSEEQGLLTYFGKNEKGQPAQLHEGELSNFIQLNRPSDRLLSAQTDSSKWFELRVASLRHRYRLARQETFGLSGARTALLGHQLYIAHEVANRYAPRVLLADEVGLGKTIEAGVILHHQLITERAGRALIIVPESLIHQWLVEMLRRFNLHFALFDEERCQAIEESENIDNPFHAEQLVICSLDFLCANPERFSQAIVGDWDLLIVDEAHHLQWSAEQPSHEYQVVESLAKVTPGVLLLTATPEQLGKASHFARLRLLDPDRFPSLDQFIEEEQHYQPIANAIEALLSEDALTSETLTLLQQTAGEGENVIHLKKLQDIEADEAEQQVARTALIEHLLDRHGTGRVLFRNTRAAIKGFPERKTELYPLPLPAEYRQAYTDSQHSGLPNPQHLLSPELLYQANKGTRKKGWTQFDPRVSWLADFVRKIRPEKILIITSSANSAMDLSDHLRKTDGIHAALFHEHMSLLERDRAASYFANHENGAQILICSEIGSEGRNFQFAHHEVLFDLPYNPDLLEQRIGRLDRIGQTQTIHIHVPYLEDCAQMVMAQWYHKGLQAFDKTCPAAQSVFKKVEDELLQALHDFDESAQELSSLLGATETLHARFSEALQQGRDRLLEYNSCRKPVANRLIHSAQELDNSPELAEYIEQLFDCYGVDMEDDTEHSYIARPGLHMHVSSFPELPEEGLAITFDRATALSNEDIQFISWDHPMTLRAMELSLSNEKGNSSVIAVKHPKLKPGTLVLESIFVLDPNTSPELQSRRYLPPSIIQVMIDHKGKPVTGVSHEALNEALIKIDSNTASKVIKSQASNIRSMLADTQQRIDQIAGEEIQNSYAPALATLDTEIERLEALQKVNPNVRDEEIKFFRTQKHLLQTTLAESKFRLDALRVIVAT